MKTLKHLIALIFLALCPFATAAVEEEPLTLSNMKVAGVIDGENITFGLDFHAVVRVVPTELGLIQGDTVLLPKGTNLPDGGSLRYDKETGTYYLLFERKIDTDITTLFAVAPHKVDENGWREASFITPSSSTRELEVLCDRTDLEVVFPGALKQTRSLDEQGNLKITALLGAGNPFVVRWKPRVGELEGKLVLSCDSNTVATVSAGALRLDSLYQFTVAQGKLRDLAFSIPKDVSVTQVRSPFIRDWKLAATPAGQTLHVILNRPVTGTHPVQIIGETSLGKFPLDVNLPIIQPLEVIRASGHVSIGTDSAVQLLVTNTAGLSQIDTAAFPRLLFSQEFSRPLPKTKAFFYSHATTPYQLNISLADIIPTFDAASRLAVQIKEDNLTFTADVELDIRDAGIRNLQVLIDPALAVSGVTGAEVEDFSVLDTLDPVGARVVDIQFKQPVMGRVLLQLQAETGSSPVGVKQSLRGMVVKKAENQRGYIVLAAEKGVQLGQVASENLRKVHTGSVPMTVPGAQFAYRFRVPEWTLDVLPTVKPASVLAEAFHLLSAADGITYGSSLINYFISGSPLDEFRFRIPASCKNVEFVGRDVRRWDKQGDVWVVKLQRKVIGDFNLGVTYNQRPSAKETLSAGGVTCVGVETENGYIAITSGLNLDLRGQGDDAGLVLEIKPDEIPANYRLLAKLPILKSYKYVGVPHEKQLEIIPFAQGSVLPVLIEVMQLDTNINVNNDGKTQAVTRIQYKVKNSSGQYLNLAMPKDAAYWTVRKLDENGGSGGRNVVAQRNKETGMLMIPLERHRNPNAPVTIELEYGQVFGELGWFDELPLEAPRSLVQSTYSQWTVRVPDTLALKPGLGGTMLVKDASPRVNRRLTPVITRLAEQMVRGVEFLSETPQIPGVVVTIIILALLPVAIFKPRALVPGIFAAGFACLALIGLAAAVSIHYQDFSTGSLARQLSFTQALDLDSSAGARVVVKIMPSWLGLLSFKAVLGLGIALVVGLGLVLFRKKSVVRGLGLAVILTAGICLALQFPVGSIVAIHGIAWVIPALMSAFAVTIGIHVLRVPTPKPPAPPLAEEPPSTPPESPESPDTPDTPDAPESPDTPESPKPPEPSGRGATSAVTALLLIATLFLTGLNAAGMASTTTFNGYETITRNVTVQLAAKKDHVQVDVALELETISPVMIPLVNDGVVMMTPEKITKDVEIIHQDNMLVLKVDKAGKHTFNISFLAPLPPVEESQARAFRMPLPLALTNHVTLTVPRTGMDIVAAGAVRFTKEETAAATTAHAVFAPGEGLAFVWQPRSRETKREATSFFAEVSSLFRFDAGLADGRHRVLFQIAQGELKDITLAVPEGMTVTAVDGPGIGAWRYDPANRQVEIKLAEAATGTLALTISTQMTSGKLPADYQIATVRIPAAVHQRGTIGVVTTPAVYAVLGDHPPALNLNDYLRDAKSLISTTHGLEAKQVRHAFRIADPADTVTLTINEVRPEIRSYEQAGFTVADDRLLYSGTFAIDIAKAGVFSLDLLLSGDYDIDSLSANEVSHWDEIGEDSKTAKGQRVVRIHFHNKMMGACQLSFALSKPVSELPPNIQTPRLRVAGSLKHSGQITVSSAHGIRLTVVPGEREGVSELDTSQTGIRDERTLVFKLLKPDWKLGLSAEVIEPRVNLEFLHVARISEGMVRHQHYLRYRLHNAGGKFFDITVPAGALGLQISGPNIARMEEVEENSGHWRIELADKILSRPFPLTVSYETKFDSAAGVVSLTPVRAADVDLQRGFVVAFSSDRVELHPDETTRGTMQTADPRTVPAKFGRDDLSGAAFCFTVAGSDYNVRFQATRHQAADLLTAEVLSTNLTTVVTDTGERVTKVDMNLRGGDRRHLAVTLPAGADMWSLVVNGGAVAPSKRPNAKKRETILIPLAQTPSTELTVNIQFIYVVKVPTTWTFAEQSYQGPEFDLPLKNITWSLYVPDHWRARDFEGTLNVRERSVAAAAISLSYDLGSYERAVAKKQEIDLKNARDLQNKGFKLAKEGNAYEAKQALEWAYNYSYADPALNEDARVQLNKLMQEQAVAGLVQRRGGFRKQSGAASQVDVAQQTDDAMNVQGLDAQTVTRLQSSISKADSENLEHITNRIIEVQEAAVGSGVQLEVNMPLRGRMITFTRPLQVTPNAPLLVSFTAHTAPKAPAVDLMMAGVLGIGLFALTLLGAFLNRWLRNTRASAAAAAAME